MQFLSPGKEQITPMIQVDDPNDSNERPQRPRIVITKTQMSFAIQHFAIEWLNGLMMPNWKRRC